MTDLLTDAARVSLPDTTVLPEPDEARSRLRGRRRRRAAWRAGAVLGGVLLSVGVGGALWSHDGGTTRARGVDAPPDLSVQLAIVGADGPRALRPGDAASLTHPLVFRVHAGQPGQVRVVELRGDTEVVVHSQRVPEGSSTLGGEPILGWTPDAGPGHYRYQVELCPTSRPCATWQAGVQWER